MRFLRLFRQVRDGTTPWSGIFYTLEAVAKACLSSRPFLAERDRRGVLHMRSADLTTSFHSSTFAAIDRAGP